MKRIITVQDISCVGKCSLTVALPIISAMGVEACVLPTAVLSTHTAFKGFTFRDLTSDIQPICDHWKQEKIKFDAIYTGYLGSFEQLDLMHKLIADFGGNGTLTIVDPCMADNGKLYPGFTQEFAFAMAKLCGKADVIVPNITEACYMLGKKVPDLENPSYSPDYIKMLLKELAALGAKKVVLKGIEFPLGDKIEGADVTGKLGVATYDASSETISWYFHEKMPQSFHGTGDIFASVLTGALMRGHSLFDSCKMAADFVVESIRETLSHENFNWYGVDFEAAFPFLLQRL